MRRRLIERSRLEKERRPEGESRSRGAEEQQEEGDGRREATIW